MKGYGVIALVGGLSLFICGCAILCGEDAAPAGTVGEQADADPCDGGPQLEREGFAVLDFRARRDVYDRVYVVGEIRNTGGATEGVELQASLRDAEGRVVAVGHFYPASYTNIGPGETWPFSYSFGKQPEAAEAELRIVGAFRTLGIPSVAYLR
jgi:hypothetical protein